MNLSQHPLEKLVNGVTSGIGFASEVRGYKKARKAARNERELEQQKQEQQESSTSASRSPPPYTASPLEEEGDDQERADTADSTAAHDEVERSWQLDEAQDVVVGESEPRKSKKGVANPDKIIGAFLQRQPPPYASSSSPDGARPISKLEFPVAIPQRRPKDKKRGFIRAYASDLENVGISQETWFDFIETLNEASLANPWINALNLASIAASPLPFAISTAISMAIMVATTVAIEAQSRYRQNKALDRLNEEFFRPRGLFCLVMTWDATSFNARTNVDINTTIQNTMDSQGRLSHKFQSSNAITNGMESMQTAELIFPGLDFLATTTKDEQKGFKKKMQRGKLFVDDYMDRRAQAKFLAENPNSHLTQAGKPKFLSKYADPTHPMQSGFGNMMGGLQQQNRGFGLGGGGMGRGFGGLGGGLGGFGGGMGGRGGGLLGLVNLATQAIGDRGQQQDNYNYRGNPPAPYGGSNSGYYDDRGGQQQQYQQQQYQQQQYQQRGIGAGGVLNLNKLFRSKVLYLMVVNMPTDEEMAQARSLTADWNIQGQQLQF
ncbi:hypothetical protein BGW36DRAFT_432572 [Talaromyces proteolyticus]|uniref:Uncharacterized protein n=1 Tax=Talaromyces proteolyticus TaxID=1131652 RepID=A0AAD4PSB6_9EURO|nr:uncharacterized protein BGW36DRAFT_432572 [Talaromyces proteolyticus]KAH8690787.1 hypothetical protein BGW36DRAFT_432572 [Talaromyces proteolyticus]